MSCCRSLIPAVLVASAMATHCGGETVRDVGIHQRSPDASFAGESGGECNSSEGGSDTCRPDAQVQDVLTPCPDPLTINPGVDCEGDGKCPASFTCGDGNHSTQRVPVATASGPARRRTAKAPTSASSEAPVVLWARLASSRVPDHVTRRSNLRVPAPARSRVSGSCAPFADVQVRRHGRRRRVQQIVGLPQPVLGVYGRLRRSWPLIRDGGVPRLPRRGRVRQREPWAARGHFGVSLMTVVAASSVQSIGVIGDNLKRLRLVRRQSRRCAPSLRHGDDCSSASPV